MLSVAEGGGDAMKGRAEALMSELKVELADNRELPSLGQEALSIQELKTMGGFIVRHKTEDVSDGAVTSGRLFFSDENGKVNAVGRVQYAMSARSAQQALFERLSMNSLPLEILLKRYEIKADGPGDLCVVEKTFDKASGLFVVDESQMHFVRGGIAISIRSEDAGVKAIQLARELDQILVGGNN